MPKECGWWGVAAHLRLVLALLSGTPHVPPPTGQRRAQGCPGVFQPCLGPLVKSGNAARTRRRCHRVAPRSKRRNIRSNLTIQSEFALLPTLRPGEASVRAWWPGVLAISAARFRRPQDGDPQPQDRGPRERGYPGAKEHPLLIGTPSVHERWQIVDGPIQRRRRRASTPIAAKPTDPAALGAGTCRTMMALLPPLAVDATRRTNWPLSLSAWTPPSALL